MARNPSKQIQIKLRFIRDAVEWIVCAVPVGSEGAPVEGRGARHGNRLFLDGPAGHMLLFFRTNGKAGPPFHGAGVAPAIRAKRKWGQAIENKQVCEMAYFAPPMISMAYGRLAKPFVSPGEGNPFAFAGFSASSRSKTRWREINGGFGARAADVTRKWRRKPLGSRRLFLAAV